MQIKRKALNETTKVHEVLFINKLQKEDKELTLMQRMQVYLLIPFPPHPNSADTCQGLSPPPPPPRDTPPTSCLQTHAREVLQESSTD